MCAGEIHVGVALRPGVVLICGYVLLLSEERNERSVVRLTLAFAQKSWQELFSLMKQAGHLRRRKILGRHNQTCHATHEVPLGVQVRTRAQVNRISHTKRPERACQRAWMRIRHIGCIHHATSSVEAVHSVTHHRAIVERGQPIRSNHQHNLHPQVRDRIKVAGSVQRKVEHRPSANGVDQIVTKRRARRGATPSTARLLASNVHVDVRVAHVIDLRDRVLRVRIQVLVDAASASLLRHPEANSERFIREVVEIRDLDVVTNTSKVGTVGVDHRSSVHRHLAIVARSIHGISDEAYVQRHRRT